MLFPSLKVLLIFKEIMITLKRQSILASTKENLLCTLGSVGSAGMNLPVLINLFRYFFALTSEKNLMQFKRR